MSRAPIWTAALILPDVVAEPRPLDHAGEAGGIARAATAARCCRSIGASIIRPSTRRSSVRKAMPRSMQALGRGLLDRRMPSIDDLATLEGVEAEEDARQLGAARAHQAGDAEHLARAAGRRRCP